MTRIVRSHYRYKRPPQEARQGRRCPGLPPGCLAHQDARP
jgi:hypothetical protein